MEKWQELNTVAHLTAALGAREGKSMFHSEEAHSRDNRRIGMNTTHAIMIKAIESSDAIRKLIMEAQEAGLEVSEFTREMIETSDDAKVVANIHEKNYADIDFFGVLVYGPKKEVEKLTKGYELYSG